MKVDAENEVFSTCLSLALAEVLGSGLEAAATRRCGMSGLPTTVSTTNAKVRGETIGAALRAAVSRLRTAGGAQ